jgi:hypothetical protein
MNLQRGRKSVLLLNSVVKAILVVVLKANIQGIYRGYAYYNNNYKVRDSGRWRRQR